jgi:Domain of unknown function (DUF4326)
LDGKTEVVNLFKCPVGWMDDPSYVYIGRPGKGMTGYFGNPFKKEPGEDIGSTLDRFEEWARRRLAHDEAYRIRVGKLFGKKLVCFCAPKPCHGDVLAKLAAELQHTEEQDTEA